MSEKSHLSLFLESDQIWCLISNISLGLSFIILLVSPIFSFPYGKTYHPKRSKLRVDIPDRFAFIFVNFWGPFFFICNIPVKNFFSISAILYFLHYFHRILVLPWFRSHFSRPWPLETVIYYFLVNLLNGFSLTRILIYQNRKQNILIGIIFAICFIFFAVWCGIFDYKLCSLRREGLSGYRIPEFGFIFNKISCPNYTCEIFQWLSYFFILPKCKLSLAFILWHIGNLLSRGMSAHKAYLKQFQSKYPDNRSALFRIPDKYNNNVRKTFYKY